MPNNNNKIISHSIQYLNEARVRYQNTQRQAFKRGSQEQWFYFFSRFQLTPLVKQFFCSQGKEQECPEDSPPKVL